MFGRKSFASTTALVLILTATAVQAAPSVTTSLTASLSSGSPGDLVVESGEITVTQAPDGTVTMSFDIIRTILCLSLSGASTIERYQAINVPATLSVKNNLASATAAANVVGGYSVTSTCPSMVPVTGDVGPVVINAVATDRTVRERTIDRVRVLTRSFDAAVTFGSWTFGVAGEIEKRIG